MKSYESLLAAKREAISRKESGTRSDYIAACNEAAQLAEAREANKKPDANLALVASALVDAKAKHPFFAHRAMCNPGPYYANNYLLNQRAKLDLLTCKGSVEGTDVLMCELAEAIEAFSRGDLERAKEELSHVGAVNLRMMEMVDEMIEKRKQEGAK